MASSIAGGIYELLGKKNLSKGVKVELDGTNAVIDIYIIVEYGVNINSVAENIQEAVKNSVETMTGLNVTKVNIHIQGVNLESENKKEV